MELRWKFDGTGPNIEMGRAAQIVHDLFLRGFGVPEEEEWAIDRIEQRLQDASALGLPFDDHMNPRDYAIYTASGAPLGTSCVLWEDSVCIDPGVRNLGLRGRSTLEPAARAIGSRQVGWMSGRSQNPIAVRRYASLGAGSALRSHLRRLDRPVAMPFLLGHFLWQNQGQLDSLDRVTGVWRGVYSRTLGVYSRNIDRTDRYERALASLEFDRDNGDAVVVLASLAQPIG